MYSLDVVFSLFLLKQCILLALFYMQYIRATYVLCDCGNHYTKGLIY